MLRRLWPGFQAVRIDRQRPAAIPVRHLKSRVVMEALQQPAERATVAVHGRCSDGSEVSAAAMSAVAHRQRRFAGQPDAVEVGGHIEGAVHADAAGGARDALVGAVGAQQRVARSQALLAQLLILDPQKTGVGTQDQVGTVEPLHRVRCPAARDGQAVRKEQRLHLSRLTAPRTWSPWCARQRM